VAFTKAADRSDVLAARASDRMRLTQRRMASSLPLRRLACLVIGEPAALVVDHPGT
jgi:hypothetical protein